MENKLLSEGHRSLNKLLRSRGVGCIILPVKTIDFFTKIQCLLWQISFPTPLQCLILKALTPWNQWLPRRNYRITTNTFLIDFSVVFRQAFWLTENELAFEKMSYNWFWIKWTPSWLWHRAQVRIFSMVQLTGRCRIVIDICRRIDQSLLCSRYLSVDL